MDDKIYKRTMSREVLPEFIEVEVNDLHQVRQSLEQALRLVDKYISQHFAQKIVIQPQLPTHNSPTPTREEKNEPSKKPKSLSLGVCMFVNKRILKEKNITTKDQLLSCQERCSNKAVHTKAGIILCTRHKDSDISKLESIVEGVKPEFTIDPERTIVEVEEDKPLVEGEYYSKRKPRGEKSSSFNVEESVQAIEDLSTLLENTDRIFPCRIGFKEVCLLSYMGVYYVIDPSGVCFGKISNEDIENTYETKIRTKEYFDITGNIKPLMELTDRSFVENFSLSYVTRFQ
jgi:hypothetical protein